MPEVPPHTNPAPSSAQTAIAAKLSALFPDGRLPDPTQLRSGEMAAGDPRSGRAPQQATTGPADAPAAQTGAPEAQTGAPAASGPAPTGATGTPATTGPSDAPTGPTDAGTGTSATGPSDVQLDEAGKKMDIKAGTAFKYVRDENAKLKSENAALLAKAKELEGKTTAPTDAAEVAALKEKVTRYENELAISRVEATDDFQNNIAKPLNKAVADLQSLITKYKVSEVDFNAALSNPDVIARTDKLADLSENFNRLDLVRFDQLIGRIDQLNEQKQTTISMAADKWKTIQQKQDSEAQAAASAFEANWKGALATAAAKLDKDGFFIPTADATRNAAIDKIKKDVQNLDVAKLSNEDLADQLYKAGAFPLLMEELSSALASIGEKDAAIQKLRGATPAPAGNGQTTPVPTAQTGVAADASFKDVLKTRLQGILPP
jgi:hypothetical protein